jgi:UDP-sugar transporter A1/2/3
MRDDASDAGAAEGDAASDAGYTQSLMGIGAVIVMVSFSGFASVYFEGILKDEREKCTIWERNFQLSFFSIVLLLVLGSYERNNSRDGTYTLPFDGWTVNTVLICIIQASGGLLVAATLKYADSVIKTLVTAGSIVITTLFGYLLLDGILNMYVGLGCWVTIIAIFNYMFVEFAPLP